MAVSEYKAHQCNDVRSVKVFYEGSIKNVSAIKGFDKFIMIRDNPPGHWCELVLFHR